VKSVGFRLVRTGLGATMTRPRLWSTAVRVAGRTARRGWWRRPPWMPIPSADYVRFRLSTQYGEAEVEPTADDIVHYLEWCRVEHRRVR
jgi:hypothetical protein